MVLEFSYFLLFVAFSLRTVANIFFSPFQAQSPEAPTKAAISDSALGSERTSAIKPLVV